MYAIGMTGWIIGALAMVNYLRWYFNPKTEVIIYYSNNSLSKKIVESEGGKVLGSVSKKLNYLVIGDTKPTTKKINEARANGINILSETDWYKLINF